MKWFIRVYIGYHDKIQLRIQPRSKRKYPCFEMDNPIERNELPRNGFALIARQVRDYASLRNFRRDVN